MTKTSRFMRASLGLSKRVLIATATLTLVLSVALESPVRAQASHPDAAAYAAAFGVTVAEAARRLNLQDAVGELERALEHAEPATFSGIWIEHSPYSVVASFTESAGPTLARHVRGPLVGIVEARLAQASLAELRADLRRLADAPDGPFSAGIDVQANRIEIETNSAAAFSDWAAVHGGIIPASARLKIVASLPKPATDIYGGLGLSGCTSGFSVIDGGGTRGTTTAAHCSNSQSYQGSSLPFVSESYGGWSDVQWHTAPGFTVRNLIQEPYYPYTRAITSRTYWGSQTVGSTVCKYGNTTGYTCGTISQKDHIPTCIPNARPVWVRVSASGGFGDSGAPVYLGNSAYGILACADANAFIYGAVDWVESNLGVTILTY